MMVLSCNMENKEEIIKDTNVTSVNQRRFYDFNFKIVIHRNPLGVSKELIYQYDPENKDNDKFKVIYFDYYNENNVKFEKPLEREFIINKEKMDVILDVIIKKLTPKYPNNKNEEKIPPPPISSNEWEYCTVELDLLYRGDKYLVTSINTNIFYDLLKLLPPG